MNPKEHAKLITLILEGGYEAPIMREEVTKKGGEGYCWVDESEFVNEVSEEARGSLKLSDEGALKRDEGEVHSQAPLKAYEPRIPFPHRMIEKKLNEKLSKLKESDSIFLPTEISDIPKNELPEKFGDPGSFATPVNLGDLESTNALCDLGASVILMPLSMVTRLNLGDISPTKMSIQLADHSVKIPLGVLKDIPIQVVKALMQCDFVIMEMDEDSKAPLILGRPFLKTAGVNIDMKQGLLSLHVGNENIFFSFPEISSEPIMKQVHQIDVLANTLKEDMEEPQ
ncbi:uncharacterized protein LOC110739429 [Chenopodium quinoa]|uniref:uncharacterized protein LOC110739429 n=1 Tax=Chenopodium quinoa TaxID=63459 RepID=UPI000B79077B|nr:uncharacterized protein LOC110739429 [Chenopodium quinoa]